MERFWTLKYLQQNGITEIVGTVFKDGMVRADGLPLVLPVMGDAPRGAQVRVKLGDIDEITLDVHGTVVERLDTPVEAAPDAPTDTEEDEDDTTAGPIAIAVDMDEPEAAATSAAEPAP
jgi:exoribonuclease-2